MVLTRFEIARVLGARALQVSMGAPVLIKNAAGSPIEIAKIEFEKNLLPLTVIRDYPDGHTEKVDVIDDSHGKTK